jgi:hypothetical protein
MSEKFMMRDYAFSKKDMIAFKEKYTGANWREGFIDNFNYVLRDSKSNKLNEKESFALHKWLTEEVGE